MSNLNLPTVSRTYYSITVERKGNGIEEACAHFCRARLHSGHRGRGVWEVHPLWWKDRNAGHDVPEGRHRSRRTAVGRDGDDGPGQGVLLRGLDDPQGD